MLTITRTLLLLMSLSALSGIVRADDFMLGGAPTLAMAQVRQDCDIPPSSTAQARVIYHDGQQAPISVPVDSRAVVSDDISTPGGDSAELSRGAGSVNLPSAEPAVPQKPRGGGLRWQSVLPGSIK
ncbi:hypothetical protein DFR29_11115 [Tahibacter aquaticus]|uniref:Uncharacterized protein n=1 Tax=Tahibacter aquaticus TaxID=520092 RepID=A0A4R6YSD7_9GAMM|nr:hypothetical protein [Tahibacter aquaticus]TDR41103.1 hypothetical protein DFR29_11115 [Tahibacter aquaticus]